MSLHRNRGAKRAREARAELGLDERSPVPCLLSCVEEQAGFPVVVAALAEGVAGACTGGRLLWVNGEQAAVRQRFTLAHELGHAWCEHDGPLVVDSYETLSGRVTTPYEVQANAFAAEFLIPKAAVLELDFPGPTRTLEEVVLVAATFGTSAIMTLLRLSLCDRADAACVAALRLRIDEREHEALYSELGCDPIDDGLGRLTADELPRLSPQLHGSRLAAVLRGDAEADPALAAAISRLL